MSLLLLPLFINTNLFYRRKSLFYERHIKIKSNFGFTAFVERRKICCSSRKSTVNETNEKRRREIRSSEREKGKSEQFVRNFV